MKSTFNIKQWNKCELYICLRKINKTKEIIIFQPTYSRSGSRVTELPPKVLGKRQEQDRTHFHRRTVHSHTQPHSIRLRPSIHAIHLTCTSFGCDKKREYLEKTHAVVFWVFFLFSSHHYNEVRLNNMTLFKDLL